MGAGKVFRGFAGEKGNIKTVDLHSSCRSVLGFSLGTTRKLRPHLLKETAEEVLPYLVEKKLDIKIGHEFTLRDAGKAHELMESRLNHG
jgi:NADPH:quinone reductase